MAVAVPGPDAFVAGRTVPWFRICGVAGLLLGLGAGLGYAALAGLPLGPVGWLAAEAAAVFLAVALVTKVVTGEERLVFLHHLVAVLAVAAITLAATGRPVLAYLDAVMVGVLAFLACGRVGCLLAGCCHGRPGPRGVRYGADHVRAGVPAAFGGVPLAPVQLAEAVGALGLAGVGLAMGAAGSDAGAVLVTLACGYALLRSALELIRGDERPAALGLSEAQWTAAAVAVATIAIRAAGGAWVPPAALGLAAAVILLVGGRAVAHRRDRAGDALRSPGHTAEVLALVRRPVTGPDIAVGATSLGVIVSAEASGDDRHWAMSWPEGSIRWRDARWFARVAMSGGGLAAPPEVTVRNGVVHVRTRPDAAAGTGRPVSVPEPRASHTGA
jgi:hypothetical protein